MYAVIDTNILIYDTFENSEKHEPAEKLLNSLSKWLIPVMPLCEYIWFFKRQKLDTYEVKGLVEGYILDPHCKIHVDNGTRLKNAFETVASQKLPLTQIKDMVILSHAKLSKAPWQSLIGNLGEKPWNIGLEQYFKMKQN